MSQIKVQLSDLEDAKRVLSKLLDPTPLLYNRWLSERLSCDVYLKLENIQPIGSFKIRGATYRISQLNHADRKRGIVAASAGNHAQGVAWGASKFNTNATIVMPKNAPITKILNTKDLGAKVVLEGESFEQALSTAKKICSTEKKIFISPYEDKHVIAGQGTIGLEIIEQLPDVDMVIGSMGGGGLMAGIGIAIKALRPQVRLVGVQATGARSLVESIKRKKLVSTNCADTFADGIKVKDASANMFKILYPLLDAAEHANDEEISAAVLILLEKAKVLVEGSGALPLAVLEKLALKQLKWIKNKKVVLVLSGGNIDVNVLGRIIDRGLMQAGRRVRVNAYILDRPGSLSKMTQVLAVNGANILQVIHDRDSATTKINETKVELTLETRGFDHSLKVIDAIRSAASRIEVLV